MTQQDKQLLIKDLSARLPYGVICACSFYNGQYNQQKKLLKIMSYTTNPYCVELDNGEYMPSAYMLDDIKPYLRPMSSMTEEERKEYEGFIIHREHINAQGQERYIACFSFGNVPRLIDWFNAHHLDWRGLIPMGHALEAPKDMYKK